MNNDVLQYGILKCVVPTGLALDWIEMPTNILSLRDMTVALNSIYQNLTSEVVFRGDRTSVTKKNKIPSRLTLGLINSSIYHQVIAVTSRRDRISVDKEYKINSSPVGTTHQSPPLNNLLRHELAI